MTPTQQSEESLRLQRFLTLDQINKHDALLFVFTGYYFLALPVGSLCFNIPPSLLGDTGGPGGPGGGTLRCQKPQFENPAEQKQQSASNPDIRLAPRLRPPSGPPPSPLVPPLHRLIDGEQDGVMG